MVVISCIPYVANKAANHFTFNGLSVIGTFAVGLLLNTYSCTFGGSAFTVMVTGVLVLVPMRDASFWVGSGWKALSSLGLRVRDHVR